MTTTSTAIISNPSPRAAPWIGLARIIGALALGLALAGCSAIKLAYNNLPEVSYWWLDRYVDFHEGQSPQVREELSRLHRWHRTQELDRYAELLRRAEQMAGLEVTAAQVCALVDEGRARLQALADQARPALASIGVSVQGSQLSHLARRYEHTNEEFRRDWIDVSPARRLERRVDQYTDRLESFYGRLTQTQQAWLRQQLLASSFDARQILVERQRRQADVLQVLRTLPGQGTAQAQQQVASLLERLQRSPDAASRRHQEQLAQETCRIVAGLHQQSSPQQRAQAQKRLRAYQQDLIELARS